MQVPVYNRESQQAALPEAQQRIAVDGKSFLSPNSAVLAEGGAMMAEHANHAYQDIQSAAAQEMYRDKALDGRNQTQGFLNTLLHDPNSGAFARTGAAAFEPGPDGVSPTQSTMQTLQDHVSQVAGSLGNPESKRQYLEWANAQMGQVQGQLFQHEGEQAKTYKAGVYQATIDTNKQTMGVNNNNPELLKQQVAGIYGAANDLARLKGLPPEAAAAMGQQHASEGLRGAFGVALKQNNPAAAMEVLRQFSPHMNQSDLINMYGEISQRSDAAAAYQIGNQVMGQFLPKMDTSPNDQAFNLVVRDESGGRQFADDGQPLTSPKGAIGIAQVMPETGPEAAKLAGLPWDEKRFRNDPDYNAALGKAYFNQQVTDFKGDLKLAFAAYNAGPGAVRKALDQSAREGKPWLNYLPAETQAYVTKKSGAFETGEGRFQRPTLADVVAAANQHLDQVYGDTATPQVRKQTIEQVTQAYELQDKALKQRDDEGTAEAFRQLQQNGGKFSDLPLDVRNGIPADKVSSVIGFAKTLAKGAEPETNFGLYYELKTDNKKLKAVNLMALKDKLGNTEFKELTNDQQTLLNSHGGLPVHTTIESPKGVIDRFMSEAGIDPNPKLNALKVAHPCPFVHHPVGLPLSVYIDAASSRRK